MTRKAADAGDDPTVFRFFNEIGIIEQLARNRFDRVLPRGLTVAQFSVLNHFVRLGGERSLVALARAFQVSKPAMGKLVEKLREQGYVRVEPDPADGRGKLVSITAAGARARERSIAALAPLAEELVRALGSDTFSTPLPALTRLREWLDANR